MDDNKKPIFILVKENLWQSICSDMFTFGSMASTVWFNQNFCGGSYFLNALILAVLLTIMFSRAGSKTKKFYSVKDAICFLQKDYSHD